MTVATSGVAFSKVRQETFQVYAPLLLLATIYAVLSLALTLALRAVEARMPREA